MQFKSVVSLPGMQWFFFIFCNIVVVPPTLQSAYSLPAGSYIALMQNYLIVTAVACLVQVLFGHRRALMEGPAGLWWGTLLSVTAAEASAGIPLSDIGGSFALGAALTGVMTFLIGWFGIGSRLSRLFTPPLMAVYMLLFTAQVSTIFFKSMLGLSFSAGGGEPIIHWGPFALAVVISLSTVLFLVFMPPTYRKFSMLMAIIIGWAMYYGLFSRETEIAEKATFALNLLPLGVPEHIRIEIVLLSVFTGLVNLSNTFGTIKSSELYYDKKDENLYKRTFMASGALTVLGAPFGCLPMTPFGSSIGLINQTGDKTIKPVIYGSIVLLLIGLNSPLLMFFASIPSVITSAVMLISYMTLLWPFMTFLNHTNLNPRNIYRISIPVCFGIFLIGVPHSYFAGLPEILIPFVGNGLLMGVLISALLEALVPWDKVK